MNKKISLCMIVGNVEEYIDRCLTSFAPIADEICVVRAIGNQIPDKTLDIAREKFGARVGEYKNKAGHEDWPHVDDFAAARQQSFDMAEGEYCFWCDSDDVLKSGAERIRRHAERGEFAAYIFPYEILGKGVTVPRERLMRKDAGHWRFAVHECFKFKVEPVVGAQDDNVVVLHLPHTSKTGSNERNLRIIESIPKDELTPGLKYHLFAEKLGAGQQKEAIDLGCELLLGDELGKNEKYDLTMSMFLQTEDLKQRETLLHEAYKIDPLRREALGVLSCTMMDQNKMPEALAYARQMMATPLPAEPCWNSRTGFYGYIGQDIFTQALRVNGFQEAAEKIRLQDFDKAGGVRISLVHATRGRPVEATKCRKRWLDLAERPEQIEHVFVFDEDDVDSYALKRMNHIVAPKGGGCVAAWNYGALASRGQVIIQLSDDWMPTPLWDKEILARIGDVTQPRVLAVSDGHRTDDLLCMAITTRNYMAQDWFMFHPRFTGVYSDNWFTREAYRRGQVIDAKDLVFTHDHPAFNIKKNVDETYQIQNSQERYSEGKAIYDELCEGKDWSSCPGFFNYWMYYRQVANQLRSGDVVCEIGCWLGRSLIYLAQECKRMGKDVKFYAVDTFKGESNQFEHEATVRECGGSLRSRFEDNIKRCGVADMITVIEGDSAESADHVKDGELAFCYIDAAHDYDSVVKDIKAWLPKVKQGGTLSGHDAQWHEVAKAVGELLPDAFTYGVVWVKEVK